ncbi:hypothetical protein DMH04_14835 [Kibdelosporangium aridum]|uniref:Acyl-CoA dehydrogenase/oxidase C-terminal domain-containing protein n=1 Tax=Kibdelosporangium aridum TaxID=2030 RepID=A0A428ZD03_KIBAR|nr:acyl-CoA dehydrogenase family protein [Kibdelosporangium aridum]RSM85953.1 hypothetical protein DMH04_14835 [Kibdelosporangium aridum]
MSVDAFTRAIEIGRTGLEYARVEALTSQELLVHHGVPESAALLLDPVADRSWNLVAGADSAERLLALGPPLVLYEAGEASSTPLRSIAGEELWFVETKAAGREICPGCTVCALAPALLRCRAAGYLLGVVRAALDVAAERVRSRIQFGAPIGVNQAVAFPLAALTARFEALHGLGRHIAVHLGHDPMAEASRFLAACADLAVDATERCLHLHGTAGLLIDSSAQQNYRRAHTFAVRHGTSSRLRLAYPSTG